MAGNRPIEKRLINIENGIVEIKKKLCEIEPCEPVDEDVVAEEEDVPVEEDVQVEEDGVVDDQ